MLEGDMTDPHVPREKNSGSIEGSKDMWQHKNNIKELIDKRIVAFTAVHFGHKLIKCYHMMTSSNIS